MVFSGLKINGIYNTKLSSFRLIIISWILPFYTCWELCISGDFFTILCTGNIQTHVDECSAKGVWIMREYCLKQLDDLLIHSILNRWSTKKAQNTLVRSRTGPGGQEWETSAPSPSVPTASLSMLLRDSTVATSGRIKITLTLLICLQIPVLFRLWLNVPRQNSTPGEKFCTWLQCLVEEELREHTLDFFQHCLFECSCVQTETRGQQLKKASLPQQTLPGGAMLSASVMGLSLHRCWLWRQC